nr:MAG TPA: hypothetical protein [Caudoviricetes sp.]
MVSRFALRRHIMQEFEHTSRDDRTYTEEE